MTTSATKPRPITDAVEAARKEIETTGVGRLGDTSVKIVAHPSDKGFAVEVIRKGNRERLMELHETIEKAQRAALKELRVRPRIEKVKGLSEQAAIRAGVEEAERKFGKDVDGSTKTLFALSALARSKGFDLSEFDVNNGALGRLTLLGATAENISSATVRAGLERDLHDFLRESRSQDFARDVERIGSFTGRRGAPADLAEFIAGERDKVLKEQRRELKVRSGTKQAKAFDEANADAADRFTARELGNDLLQNRTELTRTQQRQKEAQQKGIAKLDHARRLIALAKGFGSDSPDVKEAQEILDSQVARLERSTAFVQNSIETNEKGLEQIQTRYPGFQFSGDLVTARPAIVFTDIKGQPGFFTLVARQGQSVFEEVEGAEPVSFKGFEGIEFAVHPTVGGGGFTITEQKTGLSIGGGGQSRADAIANAEDLLNARGKEKVLSGIETGIKNSGESPRAQFLTKAPLEETLKLSDIRNVVKYLKTLNDARRLRGSKGEIAKIKEAEGVLAQIPGGLATVNRIDDALEQKRQLRISPEKRELFKKAEAALEKLNQPLEFTTAEQERISTMPRGFEDIARLTIANERLIAGQIGKLTVTVNKKQFVLDGVNDVGILFWKAKGQKKQVVLPKFRHIDDVKELRQPSEPLEAGEPPLSVKQPPKTTALTERQELQLFDLLGPRADLILRKENRPALGLTTENFDTNLKRAQQLQEQDGSKFLEVKHLAQVAQEARAASFKIPTGNKIVELPSFTGKETVFRVIRDGAVVLDTTDKKKAEALLESFEGSATPVLTLEKALAGDVGSFNIRATPPISELRIDGIPIGQIHTIPGGGPLRVTLPGIDEFESESFRTRSDAQSFLVQRAQNRAGLDAAIGEKKALVERIKPLLSEKPLTDQSVAEKLDVTPRDANAALGELLRTGEATLKTGTIGEFIKKPTGTVRERIDTLKESQEDRRKKILASVPTGTELLQTSPLNLRDKFLFPSGSEMKRTEAESNRLIEATLNAIEATDKVALSSSHPALNVVNALFATMNDDEKRSLLLVVPPKQIPFWETANRRGAGLVKRLEKAVEKVKEQPLKPAAKQNAVSQAAELGRQAFTEGRSSKPIDDPAFKSLLDQFGANAKDRINIAKAFNNAFGVAKIREGQAGPVNIKTLAESLFQTSGKTSLASRSPEEWEKRLKDMSADSLAELSEKQKEFEKSFPNRRPLPGARFTIRAKQFTPAGQTSPVDGFTITSPSNGTFGTKIAVRERKTAEDIVKALKRGDSSEVGRLISTESKVLFALRSTKDRAEQDAATLKSKGVTGVSVEIQPSGSFQVVAPEDELKKAGLTPLSKETGVGRVGSSEAQAQAALEQARSEPQSLRDLRKRSLAASKLEGEAGEKVKRASVGVGEFKGPQSLEIIKSLVDERQRKNALAEEAFDRLLDAEKEFERTGKLTKPRIKSVPIRDAQAIFGKRSPRSQANDIAREASVVAPAQASTKKEKRLQQRWARNPGRLDFRGVDTPGSKRKGFSRGRKL